MRSLGLWLILVAAVPEVAHAGVLKLFGEVHGGGLYGKGTSGDVANTGAAFFEKAPHPAYGGLVGVELIFANVWVQHHQFTNGDRLATWTQFGAGFHMELPVGNASKEERKKGLGSFVDVGLGAWFGLGTGAQVDPPLSNDEVTDKAGVVEGRLGLGKHLNKVFDIGITVPVSWGYFIKNDSGVAANSLDSHYQGIQIEGLVFLRANIRLL